jgi:hypothetical protein
MQTEQRRAEKLAAYPIKRDEHGQYWIWHLGKRVSVHHGLARARAAQERLAFPEQR